jgi:acyl dehydratase
MSLPTTAIAVGTELPPLAVGRITRTTLALFAGASGDHNPMHIDIDVARSAGLDDVFAHGMLSMAYLGRILTDPVGAEPTATATVAAIEDVDGESRAQLDLAITLPDGTVTLTGTAVIAL